jgi:hypothetical protein
LNSTVLPDYNNKKEASKREEAKLQWSQARKTLLNIFEKYGQKSVKLTQSESKKLILIVC